MADHNPEEILNNPNAPFEHRLYASINIGVRDRGEKWSKCLNCGNPFRNELGDVVCSIECETELYDDWNYFE